MQPAKLDLPEASAQLAAVAALAALVKGCRRLPPKCTVLPLREVPSVIPWPGTLRYRSAPRNCQLAVARHLVPVHQGDQSVLCRSVSTREAAESALVAAIHPSLVPRPNPEGAARQWHYRPRSFCNPPSATCLVCLQPVVTEGRFGGRVGSDADCLESRNTRSC